MDNFSHIALGAAAGELLLGKKYGNKAALWGAVAGNIPDLDLLGGFFMDPARLLTFHRGFTHSIVFALLLAPILGYFINRRYREKGAHWREWSVLVFVAMVLHPILDCFTAYGTELFWPFSARRLAWNSIFVIDPLYTVPFLLLVIAALRTRNHPRRRFYLNLAGIVISSGYLVFSLANKARFQHLFRAELARQGIVAQKVLTAPTPFNNILWRGIAEADSGYYEGYHSFLETGQSIHFRFIPKNHGLLLRMAGISDIQALLRFSKGFYTVYSDNSGKGLIFSVLRYGSTSLWGARRGQYLFSFRISPETTGSGTGEAANIEVRRMRPRLQFRAKMFKYFFQRILGRNTTGAASLALPRQTRDGAGK